MYRLYQKHLLLNGDIHKEPEMEPAMEQFKNSGAWFYRRVVEWDVDQSPFYYVLQDSSMSEDDLKSRDRSYLRKALKNLTYGIESLDKLVDDGFEVYCQMPAFDESTPSRESFRRYLTEREGNQEFWVVRNEDGACVAFTAITVFDESVDISIIRIDRNDKSKAVYGLIYKLNEYYIQEQGKKYINDGFTSYLHGAGFQKMLVQKLGYRNCYVRIKIESKFPLKIVNGALKMLKKNEKARALNQYLTDYFNEQR